MIEQAILVAKTRSIAYGVAGLEGDWVKYTSPSHYEYISKEMALKYIKKLHLEEVARDRNAILYDSPDKAFLRTYKGFFAAKAVADEKIKEANDLAKIKNRI